MAMTPTPLPIQGDRASVSLSVKDMGKATYATARASKGWNLGFPNLLFQKVHQKRLSAPPVPPFPPAPASPQLAPGRSGCRRGEPDRR